MTDVQWAAATDVGRVRTANEDSYWAADGLFLVADGLGGHAAGEVASALAIDAMRRLNDIDSPSVHEVRDAIQAANAAILARGADRPECRGMGTTLTGLALVAGPDESRRTSRWIVLNIGDSRVYRFADGRLDQLTTDHSAVQELVDAGLLDAAEAGRDPRRNIVTRSLGIRDRADADVSELDAAPGQRFLVCSDGLFGELPDDDIRGILQDQPTASGAVERLVAAANQAGGQDNITAIVIDLPPAPGV